jgi:hypothetical protein
MNDKLQSFVLDELNRWEITDARYSISVREHSSEEAKAQFHREYGSSRCYDTYAMAVEALKDTIRRRREHLLTQLAQLDHNEANFETLYPEPQDISVELEGRYEELVEQLRGLVERPGDFTIGKLRVTNNYLSRPDNKLFIFDIPQWGPTPQTFSTTLCAVINRAMVEAGLEVYSEWNGHGCYSWSRRSRSALKQAA